MFSCPLVLVIIPRTVEGFRIQLGRGPGGRFALGNPIGFSERTVGLPRGERHGLEQKEGLLQIIEIGRHGRHLRLGQPVRNRLHDS